VKIALISLKQAWLDKTKNLEKCRKLLIKASEQGAKLALFPEMTLTGYSLEIATTAEEPENSWTIKEFQKLAKQFGIAIVFGLAVKNGQKAKNRAICIDANGEILATYDKIHPFSFAKEERLFDGGKALANTTIDGVRLSFNICYDLRFAELFTSQAAHTDIFVNIANWPEVRVEHFTTLLKARAIETQSFVIGVNRIGSEPNGTKYLKSSVCYDPYGKKVAKTYGSKELDVVNIDVEEVNKYRAKFSAVKDRRAELYKNLY